MLICRNDFDWIVRADDDSYIVIDNLRLVIDRYFDKYYRNQPIQFGAHLHTNDENSIQEYISGGSGIIFNRIAFEMLLQVFDKCKYVDDNHDDYDDNNRKSQMTHADDVQLAKCFQMVNK
jgi:glycoprotein-N-acetylgalactosamine 3-beta-galactosyltransferase